MLIQKPKNEVKYFIFKKLLISVATINVTFICAKHIHFTLHKVYTTSSSRDFYLTFCFTTPLPGVASTFSRTVLFDPSNVTIWGVPPSSNMQFWPLSDPGDTLRRDHGHDRYLVQRSRILPLPPTYSASHSHKMFCASLPPYSVIGNSATTLNYTI